mgnify:CR=1 FL=1
MTIREFIEERGWVMCVRPIPEMAAFSVRIGFDNNGHDDATEFDINAYDINELEELYFTFCTEERIPVNTVQYVEVVDVAIHIELLE